ncbi:MAG: ATP-binding protein [Bacteroidales bacterium]|nr:ATP-binding protein [Bacteroidales bacterium]
MINENKILQVIAEQKEYIQTINTCKWVKRKEENLFELDSTLAQVVIGVRRSGKSTICHKVLLENNIKYGYVNLDDDRLTNIHTEDLNLVLSCIYQIYGTDIQYLFLDEIQNVDGWYLFVNRLLRSNMKIFVTGSNAKLLSGELATHLTGRYNEIHLFPFSFSEYCDFHKIDTHSITTKANAERKHAFMEYISNGGFPEIQNLRNKRTYIQSLIEAIVTKDIQKRFKIRNIDTLRKTTNHLINNICQEINYEEIAKILGVTDNTIRKYIDYLRQAFLVQLLTKHSYKSKERIRNAKAYIIDPGLQNHRENSFAPENIGWRLENIVFIELLRRCTNDYLDLYYYKANARSKEVDFVICNQNKAIELIQVAYEIDNTKTFNREVSSLINASETLKCDNLSLIAFDETHDIELQGKTIHIISAIEWLLKDNYI